MLTDSPFELFFDCVGLVLIVIFSAGVVDDLGHAIATVRSWRRG